MGLSWRKRRNSPVGIGGYATIAIACASVILPAFLIALNQPAKPWPAYPVKSSPVWLINVAEHAGLLMHNVNGDAFDFEPGRFPAPTSHLYRNNHDGTFTDVTAAAGLAVTGWGQEVCVGDYDNDGYDDLHVTYYGKNHLFHNQGNGTFKDVTDTAGVGGTGNE